MDVLPNPLVPLNNAREEARQDLLRNVETPVEKFCPKCGKQLHVREGEWICVNSKCDQS